MGTSAVTRLDARRREEAGTVRQDPLEAVGGDSLRRIFSLLAPSSLLQAALVSRGWRELAEEDQLWEPCCAVRRWARQLQCGLSPNTGLCACAWAGTLGILASIGLKQFLIAMAPTWRSVPQEAPVASPAPPSLRCLHAALQAAWQRLMYVPAAQRSELPWKQRYLLAEADASRTEITGGWVGGWAGGRAGGWVPGREGGWRVGRLAGGWLTG